MNSICSHNSCKGCFACQNVCPKQCIELVSDSYGELHPQIDQSKCIECMRCVKACPTNRNNHFHEPLSCYAAWRTNKGSRKFSASGGIGAIFAEHFIQSGGLVVGTKFDSNLTPVLSIADNLSSIEDFKGSKYVQSLVNTIYIDTKRLLDQGRKILFVGTPCQIAGLYGVLGKDYSNLITVDLICHGVCPTSYFKNEIGYLSKQFDLGKITNVSFRGNGKEGKHDLNFVLNLFNEGQIILSKPAMVQPYFRGFLRGITLRENCFTCEFAQPKRISDITIGDFIGLGYIVPFNGPMYNTSLIITNTQKGEQYFKEVILTNEFNYEIRSYSEALKYGTSLKSPFPRHKKFFLFRQLYLKFGFSKSIRSILKWDIFWYQLTFWPNRLLIKAPKKIWNLVSRKFIKGHL